MSNKSRSILAILSTDIVGYTKATEQDESHAFSLIAKHRDIVPKYVEERNGHLFKEMGDGTFSKFDSAIDAAHCAIKIQNEAIERNLPLRIGVHLGDVLQEGDDILGIGINIADRIQKLAETGKIYISDDIWRQIKNQPDLDANEIGEHSLKGIEGKVTLYDLIFNTDGTITEKIEVTHKIQANDEEGKKIEEEAPKIEYLKKVALFFFNNKTNDKNLDWLQYGLMYATTYKLLQEKLIDVYQASFTDTMKKAGYSNGVGIPNPLKRKISTLSSREFWFSGDIFKDNDNYRIVTELYSVKTGKLIREREFLGNNIFSIIDNISLQMRYDLDIPSSHIEESSNESISDIYTSNLKAFELYTSGIINRRRDNNIEECIKKFELALKHDKDFAMLYLQLAEIYVFYKPEKISEVFKKAMSLIFKLPDPLKYDLKNKYFTFVEKNPDKCLKLIQLWTKLQPENYDAHLNLAEIYERLEKLDDAVKEYELLFKLYEYDYDILSELVGLHVRKNKYDEALKKLDAYSKNFSDDYRPYYRMGGIYRNINDFDRAMDSYDTASLIEPDNIYVLGEINELKTRFGDYEPAVESMKNLLLEKNITSNEHEHVTHRLVVMYENLGKYKNSIKLRTKELEREGELDSRNKDVATLMPNINAFFYLVEIARLHLMNNEKKPAEKIIGQLNKEMTKPPLVNILKIFCAELFVLLKDTKNTEECLSEGIKVVTEYGLSVFGHEYDRVSGMLCELNNDFDEAIKYYKKAVHESPP